MIKIYIKKYFENQVFQRGRFLNIFREDDRGTKALLQFVKPIADQGDVGK